MVESRDAISLMGPSIRRLSPLKAWLQCRVFDEDDDDEGGPAGYRIMRISEISVCLMLLIQPAYADVSEHDLYRALCVTNLSIIFRWDGSRWQQHTLMANDKYIIQKLDSSNLLAEICEGEITPITRASIVISKSCYVFSFLGQ